MTEPSPGSAPSGRKVETVDSVVIRFAGDSGDGMQLAGEEFSRSVAAEGLGFATRPEYPSEIRAPAGSLFGVSGFQVQYAGHEVLTSGDQVDVLVAMNPAALRLSLPEVRRGGMIIADSGAFSDANLARAGYRTSPLSDGSLEVYRVCGVDIGGLTAQALTDFGLSRREIGRSRNYFALGLALWLFHRDLEQEVAAIERRFASQPVLEAANIAALRAGFAYGDSAELFPVTFEVRPAPAAPGRYRSITGNQGIALGAVAAAELAGLRLFAGSYPITPASDIFQTLAGLRQFDVVTFQAEDEIAAACSAVGAAFGGALALTTTSGPGMSLKTEAIGLAVMLELPLVIVNVQRGGPSTGLPTRLEQADLLQAVYGRHGEAPLPVLAARSPGDCFDCALEAFRIAVRYMTPVVLLSDGAIGNSAEAWRIPDLEGLVPPAPKFRTDPEGFHPYQRDEHLARPWVRPGTPGLEHRLGGLEKDCLTGEISSDPANHQRMVETRAAKVARVADDIPPLVPAGAPAGDLVVVGWGGTYGAIEQAVERANAEGLAVGHLHLRHLNPLPSDLGEVLRRYRRVLVPELNLGQLARLIRERCLLDVAQLDKMQGRPLSVGEVHDRIRELVP